MDYMGMDPAKFASMLLSRKPGATTKQITFDRTALRKKARLLKKGEDEFAVSRDDYADKISQEEQDEIDSVQGKLFASKESRQEKKKQEIRKRHTDRYDARFKGSDYEGEIEKQKAYSEEMLDQMIGHYDRVRSVQEAATNAGNSAGAAAADDVAMALKDIMVFSKEKFDGAGYEKKLFELTKLYSALYRRCGVLIDKLKGSEVGEIVDLRDMYNAQSIRIDAEAERCARRGEDTMWSTVMQRAQGIKMKERAAGSSKKTESGIASSVRKVKKKHEEGNSYFKAKESLDDLDKLFYQAVRDGADPGSKDYKKWVKLINNPKFFKDFDAASRKYLSYEGKMNQDVTLTYDEKYKAAMTKWFKSHYGRSFKNPKAFGEMAARFGSEFMMHSLQYLHKLGMKGGDDISSRNFASKRIASLLGIGDSIVSSEVVSYAETGEKGQTKVTEGFVMADSKGLGTSQLAHTLVFDNDCYNVVFSPEAKKELQNLQILDTITGQIDRHQDNVNLQYYVSKSPYSEGMRKDEAETGLPSLDSFSFDSTSSSEQDKQPEMVNVACITHVVGIDNDMAFGTKFDLSKNKADKTIGALVQKPGVGYGLKGSYIDKGMKESLKITEVEDIRAALTGLIGEEYIDATVARFVLLKATALKGEGFTGGFKELSKYVDLVEQYCEDGPAKGMFRAIVNSGSADRLSGSQELTIDDWGNLLCTTKVSEFDEESYSYYYYINKVLNMKIEEAMNARKSGR